MQVPLEHGDASHCGQEGEEGGHHSCESRERYDSVAIVECLVWPTVATYVPSKIIRSTTSCKDGASGYEAQVRILRMCVQTPECNVTAIRSIGRTVLSYIAAAGDYERFQILLKMTSALDRKVLLNDTGDSAGRSRI